METSSCQIFHSELNLLSFGLALVLFICLLGTGQAQMIEEIHLLDGTKIRGEIIQRDTSDVVILQLEDGREMSFRKSEISRFKQKRGPLPYDSTTPFYGAVDLGISRGFGLHLSAGHQFARLFGLGAGVGYDYYATQFDDYYILSVFGEVRGQLLNKPATPYYSLRVGYGKGISDDEEFVNRESEGGMLWAPQIGYSFATRGQLRWNFGVGMRFQDQTYLRDSGWSNQRMEQNFRRYEMSIGVLF